MHCSFAMLLVPDSSFWAAPAPPNGAITQSHSMIPCFRLRWSARHGHVEHFAPCHPVCRQNLPIQGIPLGQKRIGAHGFQSAHGLSLGFWQRPISCLRCLVNCLDPGHVRELRGCAASTATKLNKRGRHFMGLAYAYIQPFSTFQPPQCR